MPSVQVAPAARVLGQLFVSSNSPVIEIPVIASGTSAVFVKMTVFEALTVPTFWFPKLRLVGLTLAASWTKSMVNQSEDVVAPLMLPVTITSPPEKAREKGKGP